MSAIGPELPPHLRHLSQRNEDPENPEQDDSEDDYAPALPPDMIPSTSSKPTPSFSSSFPSSKPSTVSEPYQGPRYNATYDSDPDDDDDIGPKPPPSNAVLPTVDPVAEFIAKEERRKERIREQEEEKKKGPKREEWMLVPPSQGDLLAKLDPTKLTKPRQFARTTPASASNIKSPGASNLWTETPAERQQRLADEVMGKKRPATRVAAEEETLENKRRRLAEEDVRKGVHEHTRRVRGAALIDSHIGKEGEERKAKVGAEDEKDLGIWDHGRDMAVSGRLMDDSKRNKMIRDAKSLGDRFGSGKSGGFL
ncbi:hypothetical protein DFJ43DRAFT_726146 [Lentinula guzmanii]|uniref:DUF3752 domain-containing protein n=2 Tax=Lentinula TaxID=5352 RepID=A0AA38JFS5_9AGAR|nr:hypothetical protein DFJ43DRAFT_726146 [Lentinula guzmanii]KAJ3783366.1 hypothetical protein GGU10DRAFT_377746 [Lentinula aff. detonsa]